jgi:DNA-binding LacI/PurR family transcriptional regulator
MRVRPVGGCNTQECVQRAGLLAFDKMLSGAGIREDAVVSNDDYLSAGILAAFDRHGVRMPQDVKFATLANVDLGPVHMQDLTRIESDPAKVGRAVGGWIVDWLDDGKIPSPAFVACTFKRGTTV